jgi:hypothetical protein
MHTLFSDWKKLAATNTPDTAEIERAFMDQAHGLLGNKARPIMQAPYRLGFEIVQANDDHTKMVGIFAFRIPNVGLLYAPVFFVSGEIKGSDLLYLVKDKKFLPLTEEWVRYLLESSNSEGGIGVERRFTTALQQHVNFNKLKAPTIGNVGKQASAEEAPDYKAAWAEIEKLASRRELPEVLRDFIVQDGGASSVEFLAGAMECDFKFANHVFGQIPEATFAPTDLSVKQASGPVPVLVLHKGTFNEGIKCASKDYFRRGFWLEDMRKEASLTEVFEESSTEWTSPSDPGRYDVIMKGGDQKELFCVRQNEDYLPAQVNYAAPFASPYGGWRTAPDQSYVLVDLNNGEVLCDAQRVTGKPSEQMSCGMETRKDTSDEPSYLLKSMESGNAYLIFDTASKTATRPLWVRSKRTAGGVTCYTVQESGCSSTKELRFNPDYTHVKIREGVVGTDARFVKVKGKLEGEQGDYKGWPTYKASFAPGSQADVTTFLLGGGVKFASVVRRGDEYALRYGDKRQTVDMNKVAMTCFVAKHLAVHGDVATALVEKAETAGRAGFCYLNKSASAVMLQAEPQFDPQLDAQFNVLHDPQPKYTVGTDFMPEQLPPQRIGDAWDPANLRGVMNTVTPNQLAELSGQLGVPNLFEHGVVGELVKTYDAAAMIQKYIPKLEEALDCLGRILFLLYWKPDDFKKTYGADDLTNKENEILSNFKSFGDLLLDLIKQTRPDRSGSVSMGV